MPVRSPPAAPLGTAVIVVEPPKETVLPFTVTALLARLAFAIGVPFHVPVVIVPTVLMSVPTNLVDVMLPARSALVTLPAPIVGLG